MCDAGMKILLAFGVKLSPHQLLSLNAHQDNEVLVSATFPGLCQTFRKRRTEIWSLFGFQVFFFASNGVSAPGAFVGAKNLQECDKHARKQEGAVEV